MNKKEMPTKSRHKESGKSDEVEAIALQRYTKGGVHTSEPPQKQSINVNKNTSSVSSISLSEETKATQMQRVFDCFAEHPRTMLDVSIATGIFRANICRYVATLRKAGRIQIHHFDKDVHTRMKSAYLTTDTLLFGQPMFDQLNLFD